MANVNPAVTAYTNTLNNFKNPVGGDTGGDSAGGAAFGDILQQSLKSAVDSQHTSEKMSGAALSGKADMTDVLQALTNAEMALNTVLAVRDKVVQAYQEVMRTPM